MGLKSFFFFFLLITFTMKGKVPDCGLSTPRTPSLKINYSPDVKEIEICSIKMYMCYLQSSALPVQRTTHTAKDLAAESCHCHLGLLNFKTLHSPSFSRAIRMAFACHVN
jgi:hypothetical protein